MTQAYPLQWPIGWPRARSRKDARFGIGERKFNADATSSYISRGDMTMDEAYRRLAGELEKLGVNPDDDSVISTNLTLNLRGLPRGNQGEPYDPGVAVYFQKRGQPMRVMAIDRYTRVRDNLAAIAATFAAMRAIERHGGAQILERAFTGFDALPAPGSRTCWDILGLKPMATAEQIEAAFRELAKQHHPDVGGLHDEFVSVKQAREDALRQIGNGQ